MEIRDVAGFENTYSVTDEGTVISKRTGKTLKGGLNKKGYRVVTLYPDGCKKSHSAKLVHRLVAEAFLGPKPGNGFEVDHINADKTDNRVSNLRWVTQSENRRHAIEMGLNRPDRPVVGFNENGDVIRFASVKEARKHGWCIDSVLVGESYTVEGYAFVDAEEFENTCISVYFEEMARVRAARKAAGIRRSSDSLVSNTNVSVILNQLVERSGARPKDLAYMMGMSKQSFNQFVRRGRHSFLTKLVRLLDYLGWSVMIVPKGAIPAFEHYLVRNTDSGEALR